MEKKCQSNQRQEYKTNRKNAQKKKRVQIIDLQNQLNQKDQIFQKNLNDKGNVSLPSNHQQTRFLNYLGNFPPLPPVFYLPDFHNRYGQVLKRIHIYNTLKKIQSMTLFETMNKAMYISNQQPQKNEENGNYRIYYKYM